jgi:hypothetical protein
MRDEQARRKEIVDAKYGAGAYEKAIKKVNPHRCASHLNEVFYGVQNRMDHLRRLGFQHHWDLFQVHDLNQRPGATSKVSTSTIVSGRYRPQIKHCR